MTFGWYDPDSGLDSLLQSILDTWSSDRANEWRADGEEQTEALEVIDKVARAMFRASEEMLAPEELRGAYELGNVPADLLKQLGVLETALEEIQVLAGWEFCTDTRGMAERTIELGGLVLTGDPGDSVKRFLGRLGRCYIAGFFPECVIMCRSILENALNEKYARQRAVPPRPDTGPETLDGKIRGAAYYGWFTHAQAKRAHEVRHRANKAIHYDPEAVKDVLGTIQNTCTLVSTLYGKEA